MSAVIVASKGIFASSHDLRAQVRYWLDTVANVRVHGTTRRRVDEAYADEQPCPIALPAVDYAAERREIRTVQKDGLVPIDGSLLPGARPARGPAGAGSRPRWTRLVFDPESSITQTRHAHAAARKWSRPASRSMRRRIYRKRGDVK